MYKVRYLEFDIVGFIHGSWPHPPDRPNFHFRCFYECNYCDGQPLDPNETLSGSNENSDGANC